MERLESTVGPVRPAGDAGLAALDDVARTRVASAAAAALAANTRDTYASQWNRFCAWCEERGGADPLAAGAARVAAYLAERGRDPQAVDGAGLGGGDRGRIPRRRAGGPDEDVAGCGHAARNRPPARRGARGRAPPGRRST